MNDLIERLRDGLTLYSLNNEAADALLAKDAEIERLCGIVETQEDALKEFHAEIERLTRSIEKLRAVVDALKQVHGWETISHQLNEALAALEGEK